LQKVRPNLHVRNVVKMALGVVTVLLRTPLSQVGA
jgi:hypothetical protein